MKKIIITLALFLLTLTLSAQSKIYVHGGYSWSLGLIGTEWQIKQIGLSAGFMPPIMPIIDETSGSFSGAFTFYTSQYIESYYASLAYATASFRPTTILMIGYQEVMDNTKFKGGIGYGWANNGRSGATIEFMLGIKIFEFF